MSTNLQAARRVAEKYGYKLDAVRQDAELLTDPSLILPHLERSGHPMAGGYPVVSDVDTVLMSGSFRGSDMSAEFVCVTRRTGERNRHGSMVQIAEGGGFAGIRTENWEMHRGTWLFGHGMGFHLPIGNSFNKRTGKVEFSKNSRRMTARLFFSQSLPEAEVLAALVEEEVLNCSSIQFLPRVGRVLDPVELEVQKDSAADGLVAFGPEISFDFLDNDMYEQSLVPIPADPGAVRRGLEKGRFGAAKITQSLMPIMQKMAGAKPIQSGWTAPQSPNQAEFRYYESLGDYSREIVCPSEQSLIRVMQSVPLLDDFEAINVQPADAESLGIGQIASGEASLDYDGMAAELLSGIPELPSPATPDDAAQPSQIEQMQSMISEAFSEVTSRVAKTEERMRELSGAVE